MSKIITKLITAALISVAVPSYASIALAAPTGGALAIKNAASSNIENVRWGWRGGWGWGRGWGWGVGAGLAAGALIGGALAAPYYYGGYYGAILLRESLLCRSILRGGRLVLLSAHRGWCVLRRLSILSWGLRARRQR